ncbi:hypothetical protein G5C65_32625, partial [Streptomyces sp. SB3404]|nr:hypothetical protein [Streptomyces boncukensis]
MSTENEGAAVRPAAESANGEDEDFSLASPTASTAAPTASEPREERAAPGASAAPPAPDEAPDAPSAAPAGAAAPKSGTEETTVLERQEAPRTQPDTELSKAQQPQPEPPAHT